LRWHYVLNNWDFDWQLYNPHRINFSLVWLDIRNYFWCQIFQIFYWFIFLTSLSSWFFYMIYSWLLIRLNFIISIIFYNLSCICSLFSWVNFFLLYSFQSFQILSFLLGFQILLSFQPLLLQLIDLDYKVFIVLIFSKFFIFDKHFKSFLMIFNTQNFYFYILGSCF